MASTQTIANKHNATVKTMELDDRLTTMTPLFTSGHALNSRDCLALSESLCAPPVVPPLPLKPTCGCLPVADMLGAIVGSIESPLDLVTMSVGATQGTVQNNTQ